ncbi:MAG: hypothetical protein AAFY19_02935, partial [Pseudomonadota bacterium]
MKIQVSTKLRAIGSASVIALTAGLSTTAAAQDMAPAPVDEVPSPMPPMAPADAVECAFDGTPTPSTLVCAPGLDADGFAQDEDDVDATIQAGAQVQGEISLGDNANVLVDGDIVVTDGGNALDLGDNATVVNNGFVSANPLLEGIIRTGENSDLTNTGIITSTGNPQLGAIGVENGTTVTNEGLIAITGDAGLGVLGGFDTDGDNVTVVNTVTGQILIDAGAIGFGGGVVIVGENGVVENAGLIQTFGDNTIGVLLLEGGTVTNTGNIVTAGATSPGVSVNSDTTVQNDGLIEVSGDGSAGILGANTITVVNTGTITATGEDGRGVQAGDDLTLTNSGTITASGDDGRGVEAFDNLTLVNSGTIQASDRAVDAGDGATITNEMGGLINTTGDADTIQTGDDLTVINNGTISNEGFDTKIIDAGDNLTVTNNGTITSDWKGVEGEANFTLTNNAGALIFSTNDEAVEADDAGLVVVNDGEIIAPKDDAVDGGADVTITNTGLIQGGENDGLELDS